MGPGTLMLIFAFNNLTAGVSNGRILKQNDCTVSGKALVPNILSAIIGKLRVRGNLRNHSVKVKTRPLL